VLGSSHVLLWVFSCGEAEPGDLLGGAMQYGGGRMGQASHDERSSARLLGRTVEREIVGGEGAALL
jgi:hypothetical protein